MTKSSVDFYDFEGVVGVIQGLLDERGVGEGEFAFGVRSEDVFEGGGCRGG